MQKLHALVTSYGSNCLNVIEVEDPNNITYISSRSGVGNYLGGAWGVVKVDNYIYVTAEQSNAFTVWDASNRTNLVLLDAVSGADSPYYLDLPVYFDIVGNYAYIACAGAGLTILDISDPENVSFVGRLQDHANFSSAWSVRVKGGHAYCADSTVAGAIVIVDVGTPASPTYIGRLTGLTWCRDVFPDPDLEFAYAVGEYRSKGLWIVDVTNKAAPSKVGEYSDALNLGTPRRLVYESPYCYVVGANQLSIIDVSNKTSPAFVDTIYGSGSPYYMAGAVDIVKYGDNCYVAANGDDAIAILDVSIPSNISHLGSYHHSIQLDIARGISVGLLDVLGVFQSRGYIID